MQGISWQVEQQLASQERLCYIYVVFNHYSSVGSDRTLYDTKKKVVRLMTGYSNRHSCRNLFRQLGILPLKSQYIYSVLLFVLKNRKLFTTNHDAHNLQTRQSNNLYLPTSTLTLYQKGVYFTGIKLFNNLPLEIKEIVGIPKQFRISLRKYLITYCFYDLEEYYIVNE
jgi:hypothetical protein